MIKLLYFEHNVDRDEELKLKTECLNEREKLIKELQAEDDIKVHQGIYGN